MAKVSKYWEKAQLKSAIIDLLRFEWKRKARMAAGTIK